MQGNVRHQCAGAWRGACARLSQSSLRRSLHNNHPHPCRLQLPKRLPLPLTLQLSCHRHRLRLVLFFLLLPPSPPPCALRPPLPQLQQVRPWEWPRWQRRLSVVQQPQARPARSLPLQVAKQARWARRRLHLPQMPTARRTPCRSCSCFRGACAPTSGCPTPSRGTSPS